MRHLGIAALAICLVPVAQADNLLGFDAEGSAEQRELEAEFDSRLSRDDMDAWLRRLSERPHHVGSDAGREVVDFTASLLESWGYDVEISCSPTLFNT